MSAGFVEYSENVGKILANLQALEFAIRLYLYAKKDPPWAALHKPLNELQIGEPVAENAMTDWSSLAQLIDRYNAHTSKSNADLRVDPSVIEVRDVLAHSRVWLPDTDGIPLLLKFEKPASGITKVSFMQFSSSEWLDKMILHTGNEIQKVQLARRES
jgi:hypothetical protein